MKKYLLMLMFFLQGSSYIFGIAAKSVFDDEIDLKYRQKLIPGRIYNKKFIKRELADQRITIVFDLDATIAYKDNNDRYILRPCIRLFFNLCRRMDMKLILWSLSDAEQISDFFRQHPDILDYFDLIIPLESFSVPKEKELITAYGKKKLKEANEYYEDFLYVPKHISLLGYDVLVEDNKEVFYQQKKSPNGHYWIFSLNAFNISNNFSIDEFKVRFHHFYNMLLWQLKKHNKKSLRRSA